MENVLDEVEVRELYKQIGSSIAMLRRKRHLSQESLASELQLTRTSVTNIEQGRQHVQIHTLYAIAKVFEVSLTDLLPTANAVRGLKTRRPMSLTNEDWLQTLNVSIPKGRENV